jgi:hypothetical protein
MKPADIEKWASAYIEAQLDPDLLEGDGEHPLWWAVEKAMFCGGDVDGKDLWQFILAVTAKSPPKSVLAVTAAGPLEELVGYAGTDFIDRIEAKARRNASFRYLLGGVWRHGAPEEIWTRVEAARGMTW